MQLLLSDDTLSVSGETAYMPQVTYLGHVDSVGSPFGSSSRRDRYDAATPTTTAGGFGDLLTTRIPPAQYAVPETSPAVNRDRRFHKLADEWKKGSALCSRASEIAMHPSYQGIIDMGESVVPLILHELEREPHHWFWALSILTNANPVAEQDRGNLDAMARAWVQWGRTEGLI